LYLETQNPRALGPVIGPKRLGSRPRTQEHWVLTHNPRPIGSVSGAPKRIIIIIIILIPQITIFFILILSIIIKIIIFIR